MKVIHHLGLSGSEVLHCWALGHTKYQGPRPTSGLKVLGGLDGDLPPFLRDMDPHTHWGCDLILPCEIHLSASVCLSQPCQWQCQLAPHAAPLSLCIQQPSYLGLALLQSCRSWNQTRVPCQAHEGRDTGSGPRKGLCLGSPHDGSRTHGEGPSGCLEGWLDASKCLTAGKPDLWGSPVPVVYL